MLFPSIQARGGSRARRACALSLPGLLALALSGCGGGGGGSSTLTGTVSLSHFAYTDLGAIGSIGTHPTGISDAGVITGYFNTSNNGGGPNQPFRHTGTAPVTVADALALPAGQSLGPNLVSVPNINAAGTVVGTVYTNNTTSGAVQDAFVYDTSFHDLGALPLTFSGRSVAAATAVNDAGTVVGYDEFSDQGVTHAFRHTGTGALTAADDLGTFGAYTSLGATAINQAGTLVGTATAGTEMGTPTTSSPTQHAFVYDTTFHDLGTLPATTTSTATGINNGGLVIGYGQGAGALRSFRHAGTGPLTTADDLGQLPGVSGLAALAINSGGDVVGNAGINGGLPTAFLLKSGGTLQSLSNPALVTNLPAGFGLQSATAINIQGQIVGYTVIGGTAHAWLLTPIP